MSTSIRLVRVMHDALQRLEILCVVRLSGAQNKLCYYFFYIIRPEHPNLGSYIRVSEPCGGVVVAVTKSLFMIALRSGVTAILCARMWLCF